MKNASNVSGARCGHDLLALHLRPRLALHSRCCCFASEFVLRVVAVNQEQFTLISAIKNHALTMAPDETIALDKWLGELEHLVKEAREAIDAEWREARIETQLGAKKTITNIDLEELGL